MADGLSTAFLWIPITIAAALFQCARTALQQKLRALLNVNGANFVRYFYGAPVSLAMLAALVWFAGRQVPEIGLKFLVFVTLGGLAQIFATALLITAFQLRNFAVGTVYSKTETIQLAVFSTLFLAEPLSPLAWGGIGVSLAGVAALSLRGSAQGLRSVLGDLSHRAALYGIASGGLFAVAAASIRVASLSLPEGDFAIRAILTLASMNTIQTVLMGGWLLWRDREQIVKVAVHWRSSAVVGLLSVLGSAGWALAMTLENAANVRALGQIELVFTFVASRFFLGERPTRGELFGSALVVGGVVLVLWADSLAR